MTDAKPIAELKSILLGDVLDDQAAETLMAAIMAGRASPAQIGAFLGAYRIRPPVVAELAGFAKAMRGACLRVPDVPSPLADTAGTGGAIIKSFNVSTAAGIVVAAAGLPVAKHGNRSVTSPSGSADVLEALGAKLDQTPERVSRILRDVGFAFLFAPAFHPAMKHAVAPRKELGVPTVFNILGPIVNPAFATHQLIGVGRPELVSTIAETMGIVGIDGVVVHGAPGFDEVSISGPTTVAYVRKGAIDTRHVTPRELKVKSASVAEVAGVPPSDSAKLVMEAFNGAQGPRTEMIVANAGLLLYAVGRASSPPEGVELARAAVASGAARKTLERFVAATREA